MAAHPSFIATAWQFIVTWCWELPVGLLESAFHLGHVPAMVIWGLVLFALLTGPAGVGVSRGRRY